VNSKLLVDAIVRQTTVLIAQIATSQGLRAPLAHIANQVFLDLSRSLEAQGVSRKIGADMFGMALRAYLRKIQRLGESSTDRGRSLWEAVYAFLRSSDVVSRHAVTQRFSQDDEELVRGVLHDLIESGLVFSTGSGGNTSYRAATDAELAELGRGRSDQADELIWAIIYNEGPLDRDRLGRSGRLDSETLDAALARLVATGRIETGADGAFRARGLRIPVGAPAGWEAAVFDHYHAVVKTICTKLQLELRAQEDDLVGGSTCSVIVWDGHPLEQDVLSFLSDLRASFEALRERVRVTNEGLARPDVVQRVLIYGGQCVTEESGAR
jgi:hypothetical protein